MCENAIFLLKHVCAMRGSGHYFLSLKTKFGWVYFKGTQFCTDKRLSEESLIGLFENKHVRKRKRVWGLGSHPKCQFKERKGRPDPHMHCKWVRLEIFFAKNTRRNIIKTWFPKTFIWLVNIIWSALIFKVRQSCAKTIYFYSNMLVWCIDLGIIFFPWKQNLNEFISTGQKFVVIRDGQQSQET